MSPKSCDRSRAMSGASNSRSPTASRKLATTFSSKELLPLPVDQLVEFPSLLGRHLCLRPRQLLRHIRRCVDGESFGDRSVFIERQLHLLELSYIASKTVFPVASTTFPVAAVRVSRCS